MRFIELFAFIKFYNQPQGSEYDDHCDDYDWEADHINSSSYIYYLIIIAQVIAKILAWN